MKKSPHDPNLAGVFAGGAAMRAPECLNCGVPLAGPTYARVGESYCCEGCFLGQKEYAALRDEQERTYLALVEALAAALDAREIETGLHSKRVACHTLVLARRFVQDAGALRQIYWGALLHDIGKIGVPDAILLKRDALTDEEWRVMRTHPEIGYRILAGLPFMKGAAEIVLSHEERFDGSGYPRGLAGADIDFGARLFAVIDTLDAMTSDRPYRHAAGFDEASAAIVKLSGIQFDPVVVNAFLAETGTLREMVSLKCHADSSAPWLESPHSGLGAEPPART